MSDPWHLEATIGGWPGPAYSIQGTGTTIHYEHLACYGEDPDHETLDIPEEQLAAFWAEIDTLGVWDWAPRYADPDVCDGTHWAITINHAGRRLESAGSNAYPERFESVCAALSHLCANRPFQ